ncbi:tetratricopeptide repeat protein [Chryseobacterium populi]|uniref:Uncharacterized protein n=1 Tax=Chryseobacterium populi TaxID=1144316 RepID=J2K5F3_9FLAO|nr:tetratricopeptide repeat protein [Chryseobacterium populi]EJL75420.1 hypothetical protein PMI13_00429 [Chryseobacterium populi]
MRKILLTLVFIFSLFTPSLACLNGDTRELANKLTLYTDQEYGVPYGHDFPKDLDYIILSLEKGYKKTKDLDYLSDKGYILIIQGKYKEAVELYKQIESIKPGRYSTASNMGTAYELIGDNKEALKWIEKSIAIDPHSHSGSEWIHVNILKAKLKGEKYYTSDFLIGKDFGKGKYPKTDTEDLHALRKMLYYQLNERISFVKPKDKIVARLLFDLGNISYLVGWKPDAYANYQLAKEYGFDDLVLKERLTISKTPDIKNETDYSEEQIKKEILELNLPRINLYTSILALIAVAVVVFLFRKKVFPMLK